MITMNVIPQLFVNGGFWGMFFITILFICLFYSAWKAPAWVKEIGLGALAIGLIWSLCGMFQMLTYLGQNAGTSATVIYNGFSVTVIPIIYGLIVYFASLVIRIIGKPKM